MKIAKLIVGSSEKCADLFYKVGIFTPDSFIYFETDDEKGAILSSLEYDRAVLFGKKELNYYQNESFKVGNCAFDIIIKLAKTKKIQEFLVPRDFPLFLADSLRANDLTITPVVTEFCPEREFKSRYELEQIKRAMQVTELGMTHGLNIIKNSSIDNSNNLIWQNQVLTSELLRFEIESTLLKNGAIPQHTIVASSLQAAQPHNVGSGNIMANEPIVIDIFPRLGDTGYFGDLTRTYVKGKAKSIVKKAFNAVVEARNESKAILRSDIKASEPYLLAKNILEKHGFKTGIDKQKRNVGFFHSLGHGVGVEIHELPRLSLNANNILKGGEIVTVEPGLYYPTWGGIRMEDIVYIRKKDALCLTKIGDEFEIA